MKNHLVAERYARALSECIAEASELEETLRILQDMAALFSTHHDLHSCLANPAIDRRARHTVLDEVLKTFNPPDHLLRFLHLLLDRGRLVDLPDIVVLFEQIVDARLNRVAATVQTAHALSEANQERLRQGLERYSGKTIRMTCDVDPALIDGVVARIGSTVIDGSLRSRLNRIKERVLAEEI